VRRLGLRNEGHPARCPRPDGVRKACSLIFALTGTGTLACAHFVIEKTFPRHTPGFAPDAPRPPFGSFELNPGKQVRIRPARMAGTGCLAVRFEDLEKRSMPDICYTYYESPLGNTLLAADDRGLRLISFAAGKRSERPESNWRKDSAPFNETIRQLRAYFAGELRDFHLPLSLIGTDFQLGVWQMLQTIPYGETTSYGQLARRLGNPNASRAVGLANGSNPIPIIVPCHRVIGSNGSLVGYGGGLPNKKALLALESRQRRLPVSEIEVTLTSK
jgi:methylated-DNA-[protein]-cysteine S-methyltransferase